MTENENVVRRSSIVRLHFASLASMFPPSRCDSSLKRFVEIRFVRLARDHRRVHCHARGYSAENGTISDEEEYYDKAVLRAT